MRSDGPPHQVNALKDLFGVPGEGGRPSLGRVVLFCNSKESARFVDHTLTEEGYATANYHGAVPANERAANFARFTSGEAHVLVTTDLAARGLDQLDVSHVAQLDAGPSHASACKRSPRRPLPLPFPTGEPRGPIRFRQERHRLRPSLRAHRACR